MSLLSFAAGAAGPALADAIARRRSLPEQGLMTLTANPAVPLDVACEVAFGMAQPGWLLDRPDVTDDLVREIVLVAAQFGDIHLTPTTAAAVADADTAWFTRLLDSAHIEFLDQLVAGDSLTCEVFTHRPHPADHIEMLIRRVAGHLAARVTPDPGDSRAYRRLQLVTAAMAAHPAAAAAIRARPTGDKAVDLAAHTTQVVTATTHRDLLARLDATAPAVADDVARATTWLVTDSAPDLTATLDRIYGPTRSGPWDTPTIVTVDDTVAPVGTMPVDELVGWLATATTNDVTAAIDAWEGRLVQAGHIDPAVRPAMASAVPERRATVLLTHYGPDLGFDMPLAVLMRQSQIARRVAERLDQLDPATRAVLMQTARDARSMQLSFNDAVAAAKAIA